MRYEVFALATLCGAALAPFAAADCSDGGFLYVWDSCVQEEVSGRPDNVCEVREGGSIRTVLITTSVLHDAPGNGVYPASVFFDEVQLQQKLSLLGRESSCFTGPAEARDDLRRLQADWARSTGGDLILVTVAMPDT